MANMADLQAKTRGPCFKEVKPLPGKSREATGKIYRGWYYFLRSSKCGPHFSVNRVRVTGGIYMRPSLVQGVMDEKPCPVGGKAHVSTNHVHFVVDENHT